MVRAVVQGVTADAGRLEEQSDPVAHAGPRRFRAVERPPTEQRVEGVEHVPLEAVELALRVVPRTGFEHDDAEARLGELLRHHRACAAGADDQHVRHVGLGLGRHQRSGRRSSLRRPRDGPSNPVSCQPSGRRVSVPSASWPVHSPYTDAIESSPRTNGSSRSCSTSWVESWSRMVRRSSNDRSTNVRRQGRKL